MTSAADRTALLPAGREASASRHADGLAQEPATPRALWPTFMRRTLAEDVLTAAQRPLPPRPALPEA